jgi:serine acetyltransferase
VEITTGISISPDCRIGPGLYIGHFGQIILHSDVVMRRDCNLSQGVTIGLAEKDGRWGVAAKVISRKGRRDLEPESGPTSDQGTPGA